MKKIILTMMPLFLCMMAHANQTELLFKNSDFEKGTLENWVAEGSAFEDQPTKGDNTLKRKDEQCKLQGNYWIGTYEHYSESAGESGGTRSDIPTGTLKSIPFVIKKKYLTFRIGGGGDKRSLGIYLIHEGKKKFLAVGNHEERMTLKSVHVGGYINKTVQLLITDHSDGHWGHINVDDFRASDIPVGISPQDGLHTFPAYLATNVDQAYRPQFHFTSRMNWISQPCGLIFHHDRYHLFFQHNPTDNTWGNTSWGHAISPDLISWEQVNHALVPLRDQLVYPGSSFIDTNNTLGLNQANQKTLVSCATLGTYPFSHSLAYSQDHGETFHWYQKAKPILENQEVTPTGRGPKVFWHQASKAWIMVLLVKSGSPGICRFFRSSNLTDWTHASDFEGDWFSENIDFFKINVEGGPGEKKWLLVDASSHHQMGTFDGTNFATDHAPRINEYGDHFYGPQTFSHSPDGRKIVIAWMRGSNFSQGHSPFNQQLTFPCALTLKKNKLGTHLYRYPIDEIQKLYQKSHSYKDIKLSQLQSNIKNLEVELLDFSITFSAKQLKILLRGHEINYIEDAECFLTKHARIPAPAIDGKVSLRVLVDRASIEIFVNQGAANATSFEILNPKNTSIKIHGSRWIEVSSCEIHELKSMWP